MDSKRPTHFGKYKLMELIAMGGMGEIYLAKSEGSAGLGKFVVVKCLHPKFSKDRDMIERFQSEAAIALKMNHGSVVAMSEFGVENNQFFVVMEYVSGKAADEIIQRVKDLGKKIPTEISLYLIAQAALGLDYIHNCVDPETGRPMNLVHRDISPHNLMISYSGEVKIIDFGVAKTHSSVDLTKQNEVIGKVRYFSPEQAQGLKVDAQSDIFALGVVLWELLAGRRMYESLSDLEVLRQLDEFTAPRLTEDPESQLDVIVKKSTAVSLHDRYKSALELYEDIHRYLLSHYSKFSVLEVRQFMAEFFKQELEEERVRLKSYSLVPARGPIIDESKLVVPDEVTKEISRPVRIKPEPGLAATITGIMEARHLQKKKAKSINWLVDGPALVFTRLLKFLVNLFSDAVKGAFYVGVRLGIIALGLLLILTSLSKLDYRELSKSLLRGETGALFNEVLWMAKELQTSVLEMTSTGENEETFLGVEANTPPVGGRLPNSTDVFVWVESDPPGARVFKDGHPLFVVTPTYVRFKDAKASVLKLELRGYESLKQMVDPKAEKVFFVLNRDGRRAGGN